MNSQHKIVALAAALQTENFSLIIHADNIIIFHACRGLVRDIQQPFFFLNSECNRSSVADVKVHIIFVIVIVFFRVNRRMTLRQNWEINTQCVWRLRRERSLLLSGQEA